MGRPMELRFPDGSVAVNASNKEIGEMLIPAQGKAGVWSIRAPHPGYARLLNSEPVIAQGNPQWLPAGTDARPIERFRPPATNEAFVPGPSGRALNLAGRRALRFPRGEKQAGGFKNFPGEQGTIEFWFRPNWSSRDLAVASGEFRDFWFIRSGSHDLQYRYGERGWTSEIFALMNLWIRGQLGDGQGKKKEVNPGFKGRLLFAAGNWHHVAATWRLYPGKSGTQGSFAIFIDGKKSAAFINDSPSFPGSMPGTGFFNLKETSEQIQVGPLDGAMAQLRISDIVRYEDNFTPSQTSLQADGNTRVLFPLDGDLAGQNSAGKKIMLVE